MKSILAKHLRYSRVEMDGERIPDQMEDIHIHLTLTPEPAPVAREKSLYLGPWPSLELRASSGLSQRNDLGAYACVCARVRSWAHTLTRKTSKCITSKRGEGFREGKK